MTPRFIKQNNKPLFPHIFWNRPTMKSRGGQLLIVGGHQTQFDQVQAVYQIAEAAGIGEVRAILPDSLRKLLGDSGFGLFVPASASGSLSRAALGEILYAADDVDATVMGVNLTNNAETGIMVESFISQYERPVIITEDAVHTLSLHPELITGNPNALVILPISGLAALAQNHHIAVRTNLARGVVGKMEIVQQLVDISRCKYVVFDTEIIIAADGQISLTDSNRPLHESSALIIGLMATFWLQNRAKAYESLTTAAFVAAEAVKSVEQSTISASAAAIRSILIKYDEI